MVGARRGKIERGNWGTPWKPFDVEEYRKGVQMSEQPFMDRCLVLEARVRELEAALRQIAEGRDGYETDARSLAIAEAALALGTS